MDQKMKNILEVAALPIIFWIIAVVLWQSKGSIFYLLISGISGPPSGSATDCSRFCPSSDVPLVAK